jgi:hypothetical protein
MLARKTPRYGIKSNFLEFIFYYYPFLYDVLYRLIVGVRKFFDIFRGRMLWQEEQAIRKYHLMSSKIVCSSIKMKHIFL